jgi:hypothetical protein
MAQLQAEIEGLRLAVAGLRAELRDAQRRPVEVAETAVTAPSVTLLLPLAWAALAAGVPAEAELPIDLGPDTAPTQIDLRDLPEAPLLDPRISREAAELDDLLVGATAVDEPLREAQRESA